VEDLRAGANSLGKRGRADRHHHELLKVHAAVGMGAAVEDVHHRHRKERAPRAAVERRGVLVERHACRRRIRTRERHGHPEQRVRPEPSLVGRAVQLDQERVDRALISFTSGERLRDLAVHMGDRGPDPLAQVPLLVAVPQLQRFALAR
jgi:hypothetical protein